MKSKFVSPAIFLTSALAISLSGCVSPTASDSLTKPFQCSNCAAWNQPQQPFNIAANTWYVGTKELSALLITSPQGHILLDGALPQSAPLIEQNIRTLGFRLEDVKLIVNSHAHFDHAGGIAALQKKSRAMVATSDHGAQVLRDGVIGNDDPQYEPGERPSIPKVPGAVGAQDGETLRVGPLRITAHLTPGHTPGSTTWTWVSCEKEKGQERCLDIVYADSLTAVSSNNYRFSGTRATQFRKTIDKVGALKCDVIVSTHPGFTNTMEKRAAKTAGQNPFITPDGCRQYAAEAHERFNARLAQEAAGKPVAAGHPH